MAYILGVDIGTSGTKTVLFSEDGTPVASALYDYPLYTPCNGYAEQDPADWWNACVNSIRDVVAKSGVPADEIKGVGLSRASLLPRCQTHRVCSCLIFPADAGLTRC